MQTKQERLNILKEFGYNIETIYNPSTEVKDENSEIIESGYVRNDKTYRRWIMAQTFRMIKSEGGWDSSLQNNNYKYVFNMLKEELRVLSKLETKDKEAFKERARFFTKENVLDIIVEYYYEVGKYIKTLKHDYQKSIYVRGYKKLKIEKVNFVIFTPIFTMIKKVKEATTYKQLYDAIKDYKIVNLPKKSTKSTTWVNSYQKAGVYYTLQNMIGYHHIRLENKSLLESLKLLNEIADKKTGKQMMDYLLNIIEKNKNILKNFI